MLVPNAPNTSAGFEVDLPDIAVTDSTDDADNDGLDALAEWLMETDPLDADTDGDGLRDGAEVIAGRSPVRAETEELVLISARRLEGEPVAACALDGLLLVGHSAGGLSGYQVANGADPILVLETDTSPVADLSCGPGWVAIVGPDGVVLLDLDDPTQPSQRLDLPIPSQAVEAAGDVLYLGTTDGDLAVVDVVEGRLVQTIEAMGGAMSLAGDHLFVGAEDTLIVLGGLPYPLTELGRVTGLAEGGSLDDLHAGDGLVFVSGSKSFRSFDVSDPSSPRLLGMVEDEVAPVDGVQATGSGLLLGHGGDWLRSFDVANPADATVLTDSLELPDLVGFELVGGRVHVLTRNQLLVLDWLPLDTAGEAPRLFLESTAVDGSIEEGKLVRVTARVSDDVLVRDVTFHIGEAPPVTDSRWPFEHRFLAPSLEEGSTMSVVVRATDTAGLQAEAELHLSLTEDLVAATLDDRQPPPNAQVPVPVSLVSARFTEPMDAGTVHAGTFTVVSAGLDGTLGTSDDVPVAGTVSLDPSARFARFTPDESLPLGPCRARLAGTIRDAGGRPLGTDITWSFEVTDLADRCELARGLRLGETWEALALPRSAAPDCGITTNRLGAWFTFEGTGELIALNMEPAGSVRLFTGDCAAPTCVEGASGPCGLPAADEVRSFTTCTEAESTYYVWVAWSTTSGPRRVTLREGSVEPCLEQTPSTVLLGNDLRLRLNAPLAAAIDPSTAFQVVEAGDDETHGTSDDVSVSVTVRYGADDRELLFELHEPMPGRYRASFGPGPPDRCGRPIPDMLTWDVTIPEQDHYGLEAAPTIGLGVVEGNTVGARPSLEVPAVCGSFLDLFDPVTWYRFVGTGARVRFSTCDPGTDYDTQLVVLRLESGELTCVDGSDNDENCPSLGPSSVTLCTEPGTDYRIGVTGFLAAGSFVLDVSEVDEPCPGSRSEAALLPSTGLIAATTRGGELGTAPVCHEPASAVPESWYRLIGTGEEVVLSLCEADGGLAEAPTRIDLYREVEDELTCFDVLHETCGDGERVRACTVLGEETWVRLRGRFESSEGDLLVQVSGGGRCLASCEFPTALEPGSMVAGTTTGLDRIDDPACATSDVGGDAWYRVEGTGRLLTASTCAEDGGSASVPTRLTLYSADCAEPDCLAEGVPCGLEGTELTWCGLPGREYRLRLDSPLGLEGDHELALVDAGNCPHFGSCEEAGSIGSLPATVSSFTSGAPVSDSPACVDEFGFPLEFLLGEAWYRVRGTGGPLVASTCSQETDFWAFVLVYEGDCNGLSCVTASANAECFPARATWDSVAGRDYWIRVSGWDEGVFELRVEEGE